MSLSLTSLLYSSSQPIATSLPSPTPKALDTQMTSVWNKVKSIKSHAVQFADSVVGKVLQYSLADLVGGMTGGILGSLLMNKIKGIFGETIGKWMLLSTAVGAEGIVLQAHETRITNLYMSAIIALIIYKDFFTPEEDLSHVFGDTTTAFFGTILGGYFGLVLAKSPVHFFDTAGPQNSYCRNSAKYILAGSLFDLIIIKPSNPILGMTYQLIRCTIQISAYNSHKILPEIKHLVIQQSNPNRKKVPIIANLLLNTYCGQSAEYVSHQLALSLSLKIRKQGEALLKSTQPLLKRIKISSSQFIPLNDLVSSIKKLAEDEIIALPHLIMNSLLGYLHVLQSPSIQKYYEDAEKQKKKIDQYQLKCAIKQELCPTASICSFYAAKKVSECLVRKIDLNTLLNYIDSIPELEKHLLGFTLLKQKQLQSIATAVSFHLKYYFIFTLLNYSNLKAKADESEFFYALNGLVFKYYVSAVMPPVLARTIQTSIQCSLSIFFKIASILNGDRAETSEEPFVMIKSDSMNDAEFNDMLLSIESKSIQIEISESDETDTLGIPEVGLDNDRNEYVMVTKS